MSCYDDDLNAGDEQMLEAFGRPVRLPNRADPIIAIFNEPYARTDLPSSGAGFITGTVTSITVKSGSVDGIAKRDVIQVPKKRELDEKGNLVWGSWTDYVVKEPQPDGTGLTVIYLEPHTTSENSMYSKY